MPGEFPSTRHSVVQALGSPEPEVRRRAFDTLVRSYWKPVYKYVRLRWNADPEDAEDLTQDFFARAFEKGHLDRYDPAKARFRTFLRVCVDGAVANARKAGARLKRGGDITFVTMDFPAAELETLSATADASDGPEEFFRREWIRSLFELGMGRLRAECQSLGKETAFGLFQKYDVEREKTVPSPTYAELARAFGVPETQVTNLLSWARRRFRHHVLEVLGELTASDEEFAEEARDILGTPA
jgi:RNA polymerase sigma factor (sigma-70 family)